MPPHHAYTARLGSLTPFLFLATLGCVPETKTIKLRADAIQASVAGVHGHFEANVDSICKELPHAETGFIPPMSAKCSNGCTCASAAQGTADSTSTYDCSQWNEQAWQLLAFTGAYDISRQVKKTVYFHHKVSWRKTGDACRLEITIHGDLDSDAKYSTYISTIEVGPDGMKGHFPDGSVLWE